MSPQPFSHWLRRSLLSPRTVLTVFTLALVVTLGVWAQRTAGAKSYGVLRAEITLVDAEFYAVGLAVEGYAILDEATPVFEWRTVEGQQRSAWTPIDLAPVELELYPPRERQATIGFVIDPRAGVVPVRLNESESSSFLVSTDLFVESLAAEPDPDLWPWPNPHGEQGLAVGNGVEVTPTELIVPLVRGEDGVAWRLDDPQIVAELRARWAKD